MQGRGRKAAPGTVGPDVAALDLWGSVLLPVCRPQTCWAVLPIVTATTGIGGPACCRRRRHPSSPPGLPGCMSHTCAGEGAWPALVTQAITRSSPAAGSAISALCWACTDCNSQPCADTSTPVLVIITWGVGGRAAITGNPNACAGLPASGKANLSPRHCRACRALQGFHIPVGCSQCGQGHALRACVDHGAERPCSTCGSHKVGGCMLQIWDGSCAPVPSRQALPRQWLGKVGTPCR